MLALAFAVPTVVPGLGCHPSSVHVAHGEAASLSTTVSLDDVQAARATLRARIESAGRPGLERLAEDPDPVVALHAAWERAKGDPSRTRAFVARLAQELEVEPPAWWEPCLADVVVGERAHFLPCVTPGDRVRLSAACAADGEIVAEPDDAGFPYRVARTSRASERPVWTADVWAVYRMDLLGVGAHRAEIVVDEGRVLLFGAESHGAYVEAFDLRDGRPLFRFSTCYWFDFSECWPGWSRG